MRFLAFLASFGFLASAALADAPPPPPLASVQAAGPFTINVTFNSPRVAFLADPSIYPTITVVNIGSVEAYCQVGDNTVTVSTASYLVTVPAGSYRYFWAGNSTYLACVSATSTTTVRVTQSNGAPGVGTVTGGSGGGGGGGTIDQGNPAADKSFAWWTNPVCTYNATPQTVVDGATSVNQCGPQGMGGFQLRNGDGTLTNLTDPVRVKANSGDFVDGAIATIGAIADAAWSGSGSATVVATNKYIGTTVAAMSAKLPASLGAKTGANSLSVVPASDATFAVTGTFWQATQPVSNAGTFAVQNTVVPTASGQSANITNTAVTVDASARISAGAYQLYNGNSTVCYLQFFKLAAGSVTLGTTVPFKSVGVPANGGANFAWPSRLSFSALSVAATTTRAGSTACTSGIDTNLDYD